jgi:hypothetical protein
MPSKFRLTFRRQSLGDAAVLRHESAYGIGSPHGAKRI